MYILYSILCLKGVLNESIIRKILAINVYKSKLGRYIKDHYPELNKEIMDFTSFLPENVTFQERLYCIKNNITSRPICSVCHKNFLEFLTDCNHYKTACSNDCSIHNKKRLLKVKQTKKEKYGKENYINSELARKTRLEKFGAWHPKDFGKKTKQTKLERYGNENFSNSEKREVTNLKRYGTKYPQQLESIKEKQRKTMMNVYGVPSVGQLELNKYALRLGNRKRSYRFLISHLKIATPLFSEEEFLSKKATDYFLFKCNNCGKEFQSIWDNGLLKTPCKDCYFHPASSLEEKSVVSFLKEDAQQKDILERNKKIIHPLELDIVILSKKLAIEFDGLFWHSEQQGKNKYYHLYKTEECEKRGIQLIHIFEDEWLYKQDIVKSYIKGLLGIYKRMYKISDYTIKEVQSNIAYSFLNENHIDGAIKSKTNIGAFVCEELIAVMTVKNLQNGEYLITRFSKKIGIGIEDCFGRMLKFFEETYNPKMVKCSLDRRWHTEKDLNGCGFRLVEKAPPKFDWTDSKKRIMWYQIADKRRLSKLLPDYDPSKTVAENMSTAGYSRIWDCGNLVFVKHYA